jgi:hypothetical protein
MRLENSISPKGEIYVTVKNYLDGTNPEQYHIFDSHQEKMDDRGVDHQDRDYEVYSYNIHKNNKPKPGDVFLYRRPGKSTANRKFNIYGGGVIAEITEPDRDGNVLAEITSAFRLKEPIEQGDERIESFEWTSKVKTPGSWAHFWSQYGMNVIDEHDFYGLVGDLEYVVPGNTNPWVAGVYEASEDLWSPATDFDVKGFHVDIDVDVEQRKDLISQESETRTLTGRHVDFEKIQKANASVGKAGELLVLEMLQEQYEGTGAEIEYSAEKQGDGCGYDIRILTTDNKEIRVEVKTTTSQYVDGFYLTPRELNAARQCLNDEASKTKRYMIYRVYNFDSKKKTANIKVYDRFDDKDFRLAPTCWKVHIR